MSSSLRIAPPTPARTDSAPRGDGTEPNLCAASPSGRWESVAACAAISGFGLALVSIAAMPVALTWRLVAAIGLAAVASGAGWLVQVLRRERRRSLERTRAAEADRDALHRALVRKQQRTGSLCDALTGLPTLTAFHRDLSRRASAGDTELVGVVCLNVEDLREVNLALGYDHGDRLLETVGRRLAGASEQGIHFARHSGDTFIGMVTGRRGDVAEEWVLEATAARFHDPIVLGDTPWMASAAIGTAMWQPGETVTALCQRAEDAMERARSANDDDLGEALDRELAAELDEARTRRDRLAAALGSLAELAPDEEPDPTSLVEV